jgi:hypothetical protein
MRGFGNIFCEQKLFSMKTRIKVVDDGFGRYYISQYKRFGFWWDIQDEFNCTKLREATEVIDFYLKNKVPKKTSYFKYP